MLLHKRNSEPNRIYVAKVCFFVLIFLALAAYFAVLVWQLATDHPTLQQFRDFPATIPAPNVQFDFNYQYTISCQLTYSDPTRSGDCSQNLMQPAQYASADSRYYGFFYGDLSYSASDPKGGLFEIRIDITLNDPSYNQTGDTGLGFRLYDPNNGVLQETIAPPTNTNEPLPQLDSLNFYVLGPGQAHYIEYKRFQNLTLNPGDAHNVLGAPPLSWHTEYFMATNFESIPILGNSPTKLYSSISMKLQSTEVDSTREVRAVTVLTIFSALGGFFSIELFIFRFIFGPTTNAPWGFLHKLPGVRTDVKTQLHNVYDEHIPLVAGTYAESNNMGVQEPPQISVNASLNDRVQVLEAFQRQLVGYQQQLVNYQQSLDHRQRNLELFISEYVVDVDFLKALEELPTRSAHTTVDVDTTSPEKVQ